ncbi:MAG: hypothetical protein QXL94_04760 [Candidatus Parvarchaeum sp.]
MVTDAAFMESLKELRAEFRDLEQSLKNEDEAHRRQMLKEHAAKRQKLKEPTTPVFLRIPANLLESIDKEARKEHRNRQNYIIKVLYEAERQNSDAIGKE